MDRRCGRQICQRTGLVLPLVTMDSDAAASATASRSIHGHCSPNVADCHDRQSIHTRRSSLRDRAKEAQMARRLSSHLLLVLVSGSKNGFEATFRVVAYSQAAKIWSVIPFIGGPLGWIWKTIVQIIGLKEAHGLTYARIAVAISVPFVLMLSLGGIIFFIFFRFMGS